MMCKVPRALFKRVFPQMLMDFHGHFSKKNFAVGGLPGLRVFLLTSDLFGLTINSLQFHVILPAPSKGCQLDPKGW